MKEAISNSRDPVNGPASEFSLEEKRRTSSASASAQGVLRTKVSHEAQNENKSPVHRNIGTSPKQDFTQLP